MTYLLIAAAYGLGILTPKTYAKAKTLWGKVVEGFKAP
jgi:hypothetical protein